MKGGLQLKKIVILLKLIIIIMEYKKMNLKKNYLLKLVT